MFGDAGDTGADKRPELADRDVSWNIAIRRSIIKALPQALREVAEPVERALSQVRAVVEHPFHIVKNPGLRRGRICSATRSCAIAASTRTPRSCILCSPWLTWRSSNRLCSLDRGDSKKSLLRR